MQVLLSVLLFFSFLFFPSYSVSAVAYPNAGYTNVCGQGYEVNTSGHSCNHGCDLHSRTCSSNHQTVVKYTCQGRVGECRSQESSFATSHSVGNTTCGHSVQIDVFNKNCRTGDGQWQCQAGDLLDYFVWYTGDCPTAAPKPTIAPATVSNPPSTPNPRSSFDHYIKPRFYQCLSTSANALFSCNTITIRSGAYSFAPATVTLQANFIGSNTRSLHWDFGDGSSSETNSANVSHTYQNPGRYVVKLSYVGDDGLWHSNTNCERTVIIKGTDSVVSKTSQTAIYAKTPQPIASAPANTKVAYLESQPNTGTNGIVSSLGLLSGVITTSLGYYLKRKFFSA